jgi:hypothetical protein
LESATSPSAASGARRFDRVLPSRSPPTDVLLLRPPADRRVLPRVPRIARLLGLPARKTQIALHRPRRERRRETPGGACSTAAFWRRRIAVPTRGHPSAPSVLRA